MRIVNRLAGGVDHSRRSRGRGIKEAGTPVRVPAVVSEQTVFEIPRQLLVFWEVRATLYLLSGKGRQNLLLFEIPIFYRRRVEQPLAPRQPAAGVDDQPPHLPPVVEE